MVDRFEDHDVPTYAAALAFHGMLSVFPFLLFLVSLLGFLQIPVLFERLLFWSRLMLPQNAMEQITTVITHLSAKDTRVLSMSIFAVLWAASGGIRSGMKALNRVYGVAEIRRMRERYMLSILYTIGLALLLLVSLAFLFISPRAAVWLGTQLNIDLEFVRWWAWTRYPVAGCLLLLIAAIAYKVLPADGVFRWFSPGAAVAVVLWILTSVLFQLYVANFGRYNVVYGGLGAVIVLLLYFWLSALAMLAGGELNAMLANGESKGKSAS